MKEIPFYEKAALTVEEAAAYFNIGENTLRGMSKQVDVKNLFLRVGNKLLVKKRLFEEYIETVDFIHSAAACDK